MTTRRARRAAGLTGLALAALLAAGCSTSHSATPQAIASARSALATSSAYLADKARLESELTTNFQKTFDPKHPVKSTEAALQLTFPNGDTAAIVKFGVKTLTPAVYHKGQARTVWEQGLVTFALNNGAQTGVSGQPSIPGVTTPATPAKSS